MSGFGGVLRLDGAPVDPALLARMTDQLAYRGADGMRAWTGGSIGMVHAHFWTTPEEVGEEQPISDPDRDLWIAADARVDNRSELLAGLPGRFARLGDDASDAELILAAYSTFGGACCAEILGDFAFGLWNGAERRLLLARDAMGIRQLYYAVNGATVVFGSTIGAVLAALPKRPRLNRNLVESFLQGSYRHWIRETIFEGVLRVPPGFILAADSEGVRLRRWWCLGAAFDGSFSTDEEWVEGFRVVFDEAVRCRLRSTTRIGLLAGGGLDSAALSCVAHEVLSPTAPELLLVGLTFEETPTADESEYLDELAAWLRGVETRRIAADRLPASLGSLAGDDHPLDEPEVYLFRRQTAALFGGAARNGCRVVLAGEGANQVLGHSFYYDPRALGLVASNNLAEELPHFRKASGAGTVELLSRAYLWPLVPATIQEGLRRLLHRGGKEWVRPAGRGSWRRRLPPLPEICHVDGLSPAGRWATQSVGRPFDLARYSALDMTAGYLGVEWRLPFLDRRVVDLLLHLPCPLRSRHGKDRRILRRAMAGRMPERLRVRRSKSHYRDVLERLLRHEQRPAVEELLDESRALELGFANASVLAAFYSYWDGAGEAHGLMPFLALETWLRTANMESA